MLTARMDRLQDGVNVIGYFQGQFGLGETARQVVSSLREQSIPHALISADFLSENKAKEAYEFSCQQDGPYKTNLFCIDIHSLFDFLRKYGIKFIENRHNIVFFFWEASLVPEEKLRQMGYFDEVWVATQYVKDILSPKVSLPVNLIRQPVQLKHNPKAMNKKTFGLEDKFTFLFCFDFFSNFQRKNPVAVIDAFQKAFPQRSDVQLVIKSHNGSHYPNLLHPVLNEVAKDSRIRWIDESMSHEMRYGLINACDCYVSLHRSEGFGLTMAEAMLMEKPVIATGYSGNVDFMNKDNSYLCGYKLVSVGPNNEHYAAECMWSDVNVDEAARWMAHVVDNPADAAAKAVVARQDILQNHSFSTVGNMLADQLRKVSFKKGASEKGARRYKLYALYLPDLYRHYSRRVETRCKKIVKAMLRSVGLWK